MQDVNVYIKTTARGPAKRKTVYFVYVIQMKTQQKEYIKRAYGELSDMAENKGRADGATKALERFNRGKENPHIYRMQIILHSINNGYHTSWERRSVKKRDFRLPMNCGSRC